MEFDGSDDYCAPQDWDIFRDAKSKTICFWSGGKHSDRHFSSQDDATHTDEL